MKSKDKSTEFHNAKSADVKRSTWSQIVDEAMQRARKKVSSSNSAIDGEDRDVEPVPEDKAD